MNEEQAREWARLADVERAESPDGKTGWERFLERQAHACAWCPPEPRGLYAYAYNAVLALDMWRTGVGDEERAWQKLAELRQAVMHEYGPEVDAHFDALGPAR